MNLNQSIKKLIFIIVLLSCLSPFVDPSLALLLGLILSLTIGHPFIHLNHKATNILLKTSVVGLGLGMNLYHAIEAGKEGLVFTIS